MKVNWQDFKKEKTTLIANKMSFLNA